MTPVALWTGRLPGLRPLPRGRTLWLSGIVVALGVTGVVGLLGPEGPWLGVCASAFAAWVVFRHRWPTRLPMRQRASETPQGPDERAVRVEFRHAGALLGWDVGLLWFEKGGVGFVGRTVSFVVPRDIMSEVPEASLQRNAFRSPRLTVRVRETTVGIVPLGLEMNARMTLARIDAMIRGESSETILPPSSMHPDLLQRGLTVRRRSPCLAALTLAVPLLPILARYALGLPPGFLRLMLSGGGLFTLVLVLSFGAPLPASIRSRLPIEPRKIPRPL